MTRWLIAGFGALVAVVATIAITALPTATDTTAPPEDFDARVDDIASIVASYEESAAYVRFKERYKNAFPASQHQAAHIFGEALYEKGGVENFAVCDDAFGFGCFHSFISLALEEHGEGVARQLDQQCVDAYGAAGLGCSHGIGHGLVAHFGYDVTSLAKALDLCGTMTWHKPYGGCADGAFMEFDFRTMAEGGRGTLREIDERHPLAPCDTIASKFRVACYFNIPSLWAAGGARSGGEMASWCDAVHVSDGREACYRGIGYGVAPSLGFSFDKSRDACDAIAAREGRLWCREGVAWRLYADPVTRERAEAMCTEGLTQADSARCKQEYLFVIS